MSCIHLMGRKSKIIKVDENEDRISSLPDSILWPPSFISSHQVYLPDGSFFDSINYPASRRCDDALTNTEVG